MASVSARLASVSKAIDGTGLGVISFASAISLSSTHLVWSEAVQRNNQLQVPKRLPALHKGKVTFSTRSAQIVHWDDIIYTIFFVLGDTKIFFQDFEAVSALKLIMGTQNELVPSPPARNLQHDFEKICMAERLKLVMVEAACQRDIILQKKVSVMTEEKYRMELVTAYHEKHMAQMVASALEEKRTLQAGTSDTLRRTAIHRI
jgi:hypothetical protein